MTFKALICLIFLPSLSPKGINKAQIKAMLNPHFPSEFDVSKAVQSYLCFDIQKCHLCLEMCTFSNKRGTADFLYTPYILSCALQSASNQQGQMLNSLSP